MATGRLVEIIVVADGDAEAVGRTLEGIRAQEYPTEGVYVHVVNLGANLDAHEAMLGFDSTRLGVYQMPAAIDRRTAVARAARLVERPVGPSPAYVVLWAGDVLSPRFLAVCAKARCGYNEPVARVVCEADILTAQGEVRRQLPLFDRDRICRPEESAELYLSRGFDHYVSCFGDYPSIDFSRPNVALNTHFDWNSQIQVGAEHAIAYVNEVLVTMHERVFEDEVENVLLRWEAVINRLRCAGARPGRDRTEAISGAITHNLATYCLWRCVLRFGEVERSELEKCWRLAFVIDPDVARQPIFDRVRALVVDGDETVLAACRAQLNAM